MNKQASQAETATLHDESVTAEQAMNIVLEAERKARLAVEQCQAEADALLQKARQKSQRIGKNVDDRISRIHQRVARAVTDQVKQLHEEEEQLARQDYLYRIENDVLETVVEQIAEVLTTPQETDSEMLGPALSNQNREDDQSE